jgi:hypothetical protein
MSNPEEETTHGGIDYECSLEMLEKYQKTPHEWKLNWLEEVNRITYLSMTEKQREHRDRLRRGEI